jgi:FAD synthetase
MSLDELVSKYIISAEHVFDNIDIAKFPVNVSLDSVKKVLESAKAYLEDAKYYKTKNKLDVSLTSIAYCEGLLDALRLLGAVKFEWPTRRKKKREK